MMSVDNCNCIAIIFYNTENRMKVASSPLITADHYDSWCYIQLQELFNHLAGSFCDSGCPRVQVNHGSTCSNNHIHIRNSFKTSTETKLLHSQKLCRRLVSLSSSSKENNKFLNICFHQGQNWSGHEWRQVRTIVFGPMGKRDRHESIVEWMQYFETRWWSIHPELFCIWWAQVHLHG